MKGAEEKEWKENMKEKQNALTLEEYEEVIKSLIKSKAPGPDIFAIIN